MNAIAKVETKPQGVLAAIAGRYSLDSNVFRETIKGTVFPANGTNEELIAFLVVANEYRLNPLTREIFAFPKKGGGIVPVVSVDGWVSLVNSHPQFRGMEHDAVFHSEGALVAYTCRIWRKDREMPTVVTEYLDECIRQTEPWKMKHRMLRHKSLIQCARYAFGFSGIYDEDEARDIAGIRDIGGGSLPSAAPPPPSDDDLRSAAAAVAVEDAVIVSESAPASSSQQVADAAGASASIPQPDDAPAAPSDDAVDPEAELTALDEKLGFAPNSADVEAWYVETDIEAVLAEFSGFVDRAREIRDQHVQRTARQADDAPAAPGVDGSSDDAPPAPMIDESEAFDLDGWQSCESQEDYIQFAERLIDHAKAADNYALVEDFWKASQPVRAKVVPVNERNKLNDRLSARWNKV